MLDQLKQTITPELITQAQTYFEYRELVKQLVLENKTTGPNQSEAYLEYTR
ncbi:MAG TPA: thioredoxin family protein, partial [Algoriphagus sp.]|nr:thioredoxin family protein [Algoriphagus sp.]